MKKFINVHFNDGNDGNGSSGLITDNEKAMYVLYGEFYFPNYMWLGVLMSFHWLMQLKQIGRPGPIYPFFPAAFNKFEV